MGMRGAVNHWHANGVLWDDGSVSIGTKFPKVVEETQKEIKRFVGV